MLIGCLDFGIATERRIAPTEVTSQDQIFVAQEFAQSANSNAKTTTVLARSNFATARTTVAIKVTRETATSLVIRGCSNAHQLANAFQNDLFVTRTMTVEVQFFDFMKF